MGDINEAIAAIESLSIGTSFSYTEVARQYNVDRSTLSRRHRKVTRSMNEKYDEHRLLNHIQEAELVQYINKLCARGLPPSKEMIRSFGLEIAGRPAGKNWADRFIERYNNELISRWTTGIDANRRKADSAFKYSLYFKLLRKKNRAVRR